MTTDRNHETTSAGVSSRRGFMLGGAALAAGAILAACGKDSAEQIPKSGALPVPPETTTTTAPGSPATDRVLLQTAQSIELLAVEVYDAALDADLLSGSALQLATLFQAQHREHAESLADAIRAEGGRPVTEPNAYLKKNGTDEAVEAISDEETTLLLLRDIENIAAQTYTEAAGIFTTGELRQYGMSIGAVDAQHLTALNIVLGYNPVPLPFMPTGKAIDPKGRVQD